MTNISCKECSCSNCLIKVNCSEEWLERIDREKEQYTFHPHNNIFREGYKVKGIYFILKGNVKIVSTGLNGKEQIVRFATDGHIIGHKGAPNETYPISAEAMSQSTICFVDNASLEDVFRFNPRFTYEVMMFYSRQLRKLQHLIRSLLQMNSREKVADALLLLYETFGLNKNNGLNVAISRKEIAELVGSTRQQVASFLTEFEKDKIISKVGYEIRILDIEKLRKIISPHFRVE